MTSRICGISCLLFFCVQLQAEDHLKYGQPACGGQILNKDYFVVFGGQFQNQQRAMRALLTATAIALAIVFMLLFMALNSSSLALMVLATVPSAFIGGVASLLLARESLNVSSAVGFIALFGIAVQNSLVLLTQTKVLEEAGVPQEEAVRTTTQRRLRPSLMTAACAALGLVPILVSGGVGAEIEKPLAVVMVGGLVTSTLFTLLVLPAVYLLLERARGHLRRRLLDPAGENGRRGAPSEAAVGTVDRDYHR